MDRVTLRWSDKRQFVAWDGHGHGIVMDSKEEHGGERTGTRPIEVFLYALAGCTAMDVIGILEKQRQRVTGFELNVEAEQAEEFPKIYPLIKIEYVLTGFGLKASAVERAIQLSEEKYCPVRQMLGPQVTIETSYRMNEEPAPPSAPETGE